MVLSGGCRRGVSSQPANPPHTASIIQLKEIMFTRHAVPNSSCSAHGPNICLHLHGAHRGEGLHAHTCAGKGTVCYGVALMWAPLPQSAWLLHVLAMGLSPWHSPLPSHWGRAQKSFSPIALLGFRCGFGLRGVTAGIVSMVVSVSTARSITCAFTLAFVHLHSSLWCL